MPNRYFADISSNNHGVDMAAYARAGHIAIGIKASEGTNFVDPDHRTWVNAAHAQHLAVIHYHFARPDLGNSPTQEADHFLATVRGMLSGRDFIYLDLERATPQGWQHDPDWSRAFDGTVIGQHWRDIGLYASRSTLQGSDQWLMNQSKHIWDAAYGTEATYAPPGYHIAFRQYTDGVYGPEPHAYAGIGNCDGNRIDPALYQQMLTRWKCPC